MVTCVVCGKGIQVSLRRLPHPPSSDGSRAVRDFYMTHLNPLLDTSITQKMFACRRPCFVKLEQALKHTAKANTIITELKAMHPGTGVTDSDSSTARGTKRADDDSYVVVSILLSSSSPQTVKDVGQRSVA